MFGAILGALAHAGKAVGTQVGKGAKAYGKSLLNGMGAGGGGDQGEGAGGGVPLATSTFQPTPVAAPAAPASPFAMPTSGMVPTKTGNLMRPMVNPNQRRMSVLDAAAQY